MIKGRSAVFLALLGLALFVPMYGENFGSAPEGVPIVLSGRLHLVGHEPFLRLSIETVSGQVYITPRRFRIPDDFRRLVGMRVKVEGYHHSEEVRTASGKLVAVERIIEIKRIVPDEKEPRASP